MGLLKAINPATWINKAIDKRITQYGKGVGTEMQYDHLLVGMKSNYNDRHMTRRVLENSIWYAGIEQDIAYFYRKEAPKFYRAGQQSESLNYFWNSNNDNIRKIHSGFPQLICEKMSDLIVGNGFEITIEGKNEEELKEELEEILTDNKFKSNILSKSIETESWNGGVSWKLSWNPKLTEYPIIEVWQPENYTNVVVSGRIVEDIFYTYYEKDKSKYRLNEIYGVDKTKGAYIDYKLEMLIYENRGQTKEGTKWIPASLSDLEQTKDLKRVDFNGYFSRLSLYKPNKTPNSEFRNSILGESDFAGSYGAFDAVDEILSTWIQEFRDGKLNRYFPEELMLQNMSTGNYTYPDEFKKDHIMYADSPSENVDKQKIIYEQGDIRTDKHIDSYKIWVGQILNNAGLSPLTVGITGMESIDASAESQQEREKVSIRTRNKKIELWKEFLQDILKTTLEFRLMTKGMLENEDGTYNVGNIPEFEVYVSFNDYILKSKRDRTNEVQEGIGTSWDILSGVKYVHDEKSTKEQLAISARVKLENGIESISQAELSALQDENLINNEDLVEDGVEILDIEENENGLDTDENANPPQVGDIEEVEE